MAEINVNGKLTFVAERKGNALLVNGVKTEVSLAKVDEDQVAVTSADQLTTTHVECLAVDRETQQVTLRINGNTYEVTVKSDFDKLLERLGMGLGSSATLSQIKAPMPGMVLDVMVTPGQTVQKDEPLLILEAMKMENVIKSPRDGEIDSVGVVKGSAIEKNTLLVEFKN